MLGLKLNHVSKRGHWCIEANDYNITLLELYCTMAEKGHHKTNYIVYCVRNNISKRTKIFMSGLKLIISGPRIYVGVPTYYVGTSIYNMSGPLLVTYGTWDNHVQVPTYHVEPLLVISRPRDNYVGPQLIMSDPELLCWSPEIIMWGPRFVM